MVHVIVFLCCPSNISGFPRLLPSHTEVAQHGGSPERRRQRAQWCLGGETVKLWEMAMVYDGFPHVEIRFRFVDAFKYIYISYIYIFIYLVGDLEHFLFFIDWECHHPNCYSLILFKMVGWNPPTRLFLCRYLWRRPCWMRMAVQWPRTPWPMCCLTWCVAGESHGLRWVNHWQKQWLPSAKHTKNYGKWPFMVDLASKNGDFP